MKKRLLLAAVAVVLLCSLYSCKPIIGGGAVKDESRTVGSFSAIHISAPVKAVITVQEGAAPSLQLNGYENLLKEIKTEIRNNVLTISLPDGMHVETDKNVVATITVPALVSLDLSGASDAEISGKITGKEFSFDISGSGNVIADDISVTSFSVDVSGSGNVEVKAGNVQDADYEVSGSGSISTFGLQVQNAQASVSGAGNIELTAMQKLDADISGAGNVQYKGHPQLSQNLSGAGSISEAN